MDQRPGRSYRSGDKFWKTPRDSVLPTLRAGCDPYSLLSVLPGEKVVFTTATPEHWCSAPPEFRALNLTNLELRDLSVPRENDAFASCTMYDVNILGLHQRLPQYIQHSEQVLLKEFSISVENRQADLDLLKNEVSNGSWPIVPCKYGWTFDSTYYDSTLTTEMELVCDKSWWPRISNTLFWVGSIFGNLLFGWLSDRWGRRPTILLMVFLEVPLSIATCFVTDYTVYTALRVAGGLFFPALYQIPFILALELMPPKMRTYTGLVISMLFASSMCLLAFLAFLLRDWFTLSLVTSVPFLLLYSYYWLIPESPRWLVGKGRITEAESTLRRIAGVNGANIEKFFTKHQKEETNIATTEPIIITLPATQINDSLLAYDDDSKEDPRFHSKRVHLQTFKPELNQILEIETNKTEDLEKIIALEVSEIVNKKPRLKNIDKDKNKESSELISHIEDLEEESQNKCTQTDSYKSPGNTLKRKSINLFNRIIGKERNGFEIDLKIDKEIVEDINIETEHDATPLDIIKYPNIRKKFLILTFDWIANAVVYNSLSYNSSNLGVNDYLAFFIGGAVELPAYIIAWKTMDRFGRRWVLVITMFVGGLACLSCVLVCNDQPWITVALAMVGRLCVAASFGVFYVFVGELLPTVLRAQAMGLASFVSGLALLACPYIVHLAVYSRVLPLAIIGTLSLAGSIASLFLPETLHQPLPQTTRDGEHFGRSFRIFSCPNGPDDEEGDSQSC